MNGDIPIITTSQYTSEATKWLEAIGRDESVVVSFFPKTDRFIRIGQLLRDTALMRTVLGKEKKYIFQRLDFDAHDVEDIDDLQHQLTEQLNFSNISSKPLMFSKWIDFMMHNDVRIIFVIAEAEKFTTPDTKQVLSLITQILDLYDPYIQLLLLSEVDITNPTITSLLPSSTCAYENIFQYPLYDEHETREFIQLLATQWDIQLSNKDERSIIDGCGGHFWVVKEAMREIAAKKQWLPSDDGMMFRMRMIYDLLLPSEQGAIQKCFAHESSYTPEEKHSLAYLKKLRVIGDHHTCHMGMIKHYIIERQDIKNTLVIDKNKVVLNKIPLDSLLSRKEYRVMKILIEKRGSIVTRDEIARQIWPTDTDKKYSDWAIDQIITRLRKRFVQISLNPDHIQSVRGKGYKLIM